MFYNQPLSTRFGTDLISHIASGAWNSLDIAVAWVRASGIAHLEPSLITFLKDGKELNVVVGVDFDNTTKEGLEKLLSLQQYGVVSIYIHHNEAATIFHPKLYLFRNATHAKLIVGSNNITEAGLFQNTEAGLELDTKIGDSIIVSAINAIQAWRNTSLGLAHQLDAAFLAELVSNGYITDEASVKAQTASRRGSSKKAGAGKKLFKGISVTPPQKPTAPQSKPSYALPGKKKPSVGQGIAATVGGTTSPAAVAGQVLLMRVRTARGTQVQIPIREPFFTGVTQVYSVATNVLRGIHATYPARDPNRPNTLKLEMPETKGMAEPVARFEQTSTGMQFEVYDSSSVQGQAIMQALKAGLSTTPPTTRLTIPSNPNSSTWWRFI